MSVTLTPFLYQTRTILRIPARRASVGLARSLHATSARRAVRAHKETIPFDYEVGPPAEDADTPKPLTRGTITPAERQIFERIFADIEARGLKPAVRDDGTTVDPTVTRSTQLIMQQAAIDAGQARPAVITSPALLSGAAKDRAKALLRFPPELRAVAKQALDTVNQQARASYKGDVPTEGGRLVNGEWKAASHSLARAVEVESQRFPERARVEGLILSATSDFELWDILEKEVFTMPARLRLVDKTPVLEDLEAWPEAKRPSHPTTADSSDAASHDVAGEPETSAAESGTTKTSPVPNSSNDVADLGDDQKLNVYVHGPLYPAYLLLALRRLDIAFSESSPLAFSLLPRIKELGLNSYVLGVSTPFFNELLNIYWMRRGDLLGMLNLVEEMRHCGVYFDTRTTSILNQADTALTRIATGKTGSGFGAALMHMPEYEPLQRQRLRNWQREVDLSRMDKTRDLGYA